MERLVRTLEQVDDQHPAYGKPRAPVAPATLAVWPALPHRCRHPLEQHLVGWRPACYPGDSTHRSSIPAVLGTIGRGMAPSPRILHAPFDVGGPAYGLSRAERELGFFSDVAVMAPGPFGYGFDVDLQAGIAEPVWRRFSRRAAFLRDSVRRYDLFHFNFGQTLFTVRQLGLVFDELAWLKRRRKTVFVTYQSCDVRPKAACPCRRPHCYAEDRYRQPAAHRVLRLADRIFYLNPDLRHWLPGATFIPYASVDARQIKPAPEPTAEEIVVVHAPTDVDIKGT